MYRNFDQVAAVLRTDDMQLRVVLLSKYREARLAEMESQGCRTDVRMFLGHVVIPNVVSIENENTDGSFNIRISPDIATILRDPNFKSEDCMYHNLTASGYLFFLGIQNGTFSVTLRETADKNKNANTPNMAAFALPTAISAPPTAASAPPTTASAPSTAASAPPTAASAPSTAASAPPTAAYAPSTAAYAPSTAASTLNTSTSASPTAASTTISDMTTPVTVHSDSGAATTDDKSDPKNSEDNRVKDADTAARTSFDTAVHANEVNFLLIRGSPYSWGL